MSSAAPDPSQGPPEPRPQDLPGSIVPRWLAALVLAALLASAAWSVHALLTAPPVERAPTETSQP